MQLRVLVVDDDEAVRTVVSQVLGSAGFEVACASDGERALEQLRGTKQPDLLLLDLMMPGMDGWGVLAALRKEGFAHLPVIVLTGFDSGQGLPVDVTVLHKPIDSAVLQEMVCHQLGQPTVWGSVSPEFYERALEEMSRRGDSHPR
jgi:CheY-like chemotaxis protein